MGLIIVLWSMFLFYIAGGTIFPHDAKSSFSPVMAVLGCVSLTFTTIMLLRKR